MGYKCTPQILGLVRGEPKQGQKCRANGEFILKELCEERASSSPTLDRSRSIHNHYYHADGSKLGTDTWKSMCEEADAYRLKGTSRNGETTKRKLPYNAVIGWAAIIKPSIEMITELNMDDDAIEDFCFDGFEALCTIEPRVFRSENVKAIANHRDEDATHMHFAGVSKDQDGRYCGNLIDAALRNRINQEFPRLMREKGWLLDDLDVTDWKRFKEDEAYREERKAKRKQQGQDVRRYAKQQVEKAKQEAAEWKQIAENEKQAIQAIQAEQAELCAEKEKLEDDVENLKCERNNLIHETGELKEYLAYKKDKRNREAEEERKAQEEAEKRRQEQVSRERQALQNELQRQLAVAMCPPSAGKDSLIDRPPSAGGYPQREKPQESVQNAPESSESIRAIPNTPKAQTPSNEAYAELKKACAETQTITAEAAAALLLEP